MGGIQTPHAQIAKGSLPIMERGCTITLVQDGDAPGRLFSTHGRGDRLATLDINAGATLDSGPVRLSVRGDDDQAQTVIPMSRSGLVIPGALVNRPAVGPERGLREVARDCQGNCTRSRTSMTVCVKVARGMRDRLTQACLNSGQS